MNWAQEQRLNWIKEVVDIFGFVSRNHIMKKFRVSSPQASLDLKIFMSKHPDIITYNPSTMRYERP